MYWESKGIASIYRWLAGDDREPPGLSYITGKGRAPHPRPFIEILDAAHKLLLGVVSAVV
jgi:hypothetical protein